MALSYSGVNLVILFVVFGFLGISCVILRIYARHLKNTSLAFNDYAAVLALIFSLSLSASVCAAAGEFGLGAHDADLENPPADLTNILKSLFSFQITWALANTFIKLSVCHLYVSPLRPFRVAAYTIMGLSIVYGFAVLLETLLICKPIAFNWDTTIEGGSCANQTQAFEAVGILNLLTDIAIIILPMPWLWTLQLPFSKKIGLTAIFGIGIIICAISVVRIVALATWDFSDFSYGLGKVAYWSTLEPALGVINCCLPVLQPVLSKLRGTSFGTKGRSKLSYGRSVTSKESGSAKIGRFQRMDNDLYPLTDVDVGKITVQHEVVLEHEDA
ncbi:hypothetical protein MMC26_004788 [Xylographa opegraphella]|nr:hypothetical protein [Xylographa opegraphella]